MTLRQWQPVPHRTQINGIGLDSVLVFAEGSTEGIVLSSQRWVSDSVKVTWASTRDLNAPQTREYAPATRLVHVAADLLGPVEDGAELTILAMPTVRWPGPRPYPWAAVAAAALAASLGVLVGLGDEAWVYMVLAVVAVVGLSLFWQGRRSRQPARVLAAGRLALDGPDLVEYARARLAGERPGSSADRLEEATARVADIREEFGALTSDIVYRIDHPALFDTAVPTTGQFHAALMRFDDAHSLPISAVEDLAADVEVAYSLARDHAETIGQAHLPEAARDGARRAAKAARLAAGAATEHERAASLAQVQRILESLALYYLPTIDSATMAIEPPTTSR